MAEDFYFAYEYKKESAKADRLYRFISGNFERYNPSKNHGNLPLTNAEYLLVKIYIMM